MTTETKVPGYAVRTVADRIAAMDIDAQGNAEKAAWKRYMGLSLLALAKGVAKKNMANTVFGRDIKPSKSFDNMWSLAEKARHNPLLLGSRSWEDIRLLAIDEALDTVILMLNNHMSVLNVTGKNAYGPACGMSLEELASMRADDEAEATGEAEEKAAKVQADAAAAWEAEAEAQDAAAARPERTPLEAVKAVMQGASMDDAMAVIDWMADVMPTDILRIFIQERLARLRN